jgi:hypothetical protein
MFLQFRRHHSIPAQGMIARRKNLIIRRVSFHMERCECGSVSDAESPGGKSAPGRNECLDQACLPGKALAAVGKSFNVKLGPFESKGIREKKQILRYAVSKDALDDLLVRYKTLRHQHVEEFMKEARAIIERSEMVPWHSRLFEKERVFLSSKVLGNLYRIDGPAVKAYLWLLKRQEELAKNTKGSKCSISDLELGKAVGVSKTTAQNYRARLTELGLVQVSRSKVSKTNEIVIERVKY